MSRSYEILESAHKNGITEEQIDHVLANEPQYREDDGEDDKGDSREIVVGYDFATRLIELVLIYDDSHWDFKVIHANMAQQPYKGKFLEGI